MRQAKAMEALLRVISGPNTGACFVLGERTRVGRASDADIQLDEPHISRHHARVLRQPDGSFELTDLASTSGTMLNGARVREAVLRPHDVIEIGRSRFSFEAAINEVTAATFSNKVRGFATLRPTLSMPTIAGVPDAPPANESRRLPLSRPAARGEAPEPVPGLAPSEPLEQEAALSVLRDVLDYRALRVGELRGQPMDAAARARFAQLSEKLLVDTNGLPLSRRFVRVACELPATVTQYDGAVSRTLEASLGDLSAGGTRLGMVDPSVRVGDEVWVAFDLASLFSSGQKVVFRSRVVWTSERIGASGLMFGGNARFVDSVAAAIATG